MQFLKQETVYKQIASDIKRSIITGELTPGDKLPSIRCLAKKYSVNPNTIQRTLREIITSELVYSDKTKGYFVTRNKQIIETYFCEVCNELVRDFLNSAYKLNLSKKEIANLLRANVDLYIKK